MPQSVSRHYGGGGSLAEKIAESLEKSGVAPTDLRASDLEAVDEFHFRGRQATLELIAHLNPGPASRVLDIGSGLGGVARTLAEETGCHVTGVDLTQEFCDAATAISGWVGLAEKTEFIRADALDLPFADAQFDGAVTVHVAMNIADKPGLYAEARRVLRPGAVFAIYDILQGEGGEVLYPAPWASEPSISHLVTPGEMKKCLAGAGFEILHEADSTHESLLWLQERTARRGASVAVPVTTRLLFGDAARDMTRNQLIGLRERRILTYSVICKA